MNAIFFFFGYYDVVMCQVYYNIFSLAQDVVDCGWDIIKSLAVRKRRMLHATKGPFGWR